MPAAFRAPFLISEKQLIALVEVQIGLEMVDNDKSPAINIDKWFRN